MPQHPLGIRIEMAREIDDRKKQVADFASHTAFVVSIKLRFDLIRLFADLGENGSRIVPIEADPPSLVLKFERTG